MITLWATLESMAARLITLDAGDSEIATLRELVAKYGVKILLLTWMSTLIQTLNFISEF